MSENQKSLMKYKRNWRHESMAEVEFKSGEIEQYECQTGERGVLRWIKIHGVYYPCNQRVLRNLDIVRIDFMTPATLHVN